MHPDLTYVKVRDPAKGKVYIVAESRLPFLPGAAPKKPKKEGEKPQVGDAPPSAAVLPDLHFGGSRAARFAEREMESSNALSRAVESGFSLYPTPISSNLHQQGGFEVLSKMVWKELVGLRYAPLFPYFKHLAASAFRVVADTYVTDASGTGVVHQAGGKGCVCGKEGGCVAWLRRA